MNTNIQFSGTPEQLIAQANASDMAESFKNAVRGFAESAKGTDQFVLQYRYNADFISGVKPFFYFSIDPMS